METRRLIYAAAALAFALGAARALSPRAPQMPGPSEHHAVLQRWVGTWDAKCEMAAMPGQPMHGTETNRMVGGMWLVGDFEGTFMGMPFHGHAISGWNAEEELYEQVWVDSMSPRMSRAAGTFDPEANAMTLSGEGVDMMGQPVEERTVTTWQSEDAVTTRIYQGGQLFLTIEYTRRGPDSE